jgi:phage shock protein A
MSFKETLEQALKNVSAQKEESEKELAKLEEDFANVKLNPYGVTSIDFSKRQELATDVLKMEGVLMGLQLAIETYETTTAKA